MQQEQLAIELMRLSYIVKKPGEAPFTLASGKTSPFYFDCERTTTYAPALPLIAKAFYDKLKLPLSCIGGPTRGADPIADAIAYYSVLQNNPINVFSVRKEPKQHGIPGWIEGTVKAGDRIAFLDDVVTSGMSVIDAVEHCKAFGLEIAQVIVLVDREEHGGLQKIKDYMGTSVPVEAIFSFSKLQEFWKAHHEEGV